MLKHTLGGKGLATHLLIENNPVGVAPLSPENRLVFSIGLVAGTGIQGSCRHGVFTKSPQTWFYSESYSGCKAAEYMARTSNDSVMIHGRADDPIWSDS